MADSKPSVFACEREVLKQAEKWSKVDSLVREAALFEAIQVWLARRKEESE